MIYIDDHINDFDLEQALAEVSPQRREQALRYRQEIDRRLSVAAFRLLKRALWLEYAIPKVPEIIYDHDGKPQFKTSGVKFSLSHCRAAVACAVSDSPVGVDIETMDHYSPELAARVMSQTEVNRINHSPDPALTFTRLWTMKESLFKLTGDDNGGDIAGMLKNADQYDFTTIVHPTFLVTACQRKDNDSKK
jgi:4'-phosphopantetheinyl transferase